MSKKSVSIKDIAKLAGVSIATVSRVINRNGKVAPETEKENIAGYGRKPLCTQSFGKRF